jgi:hypothetical protein
VTRADDAPGAAGCTPPMRSGPLGKSPSGPDASVYRWLFVADCRQIRGRQSIPQSPRRAAKRSAASA